MDEMNPHECVISHRCSLGAFHAANIAFRHPHLFKKLVAFSGRYDLTMTVEHFSDLLDNYYDEADYNTPTHFLRNLECLKFWAIYSRWTWFCDRTRGPVGRRTSEPDSARKGVEHQFHYWGRACAPRLLPEADGPAIYSQRSGSSACCLCSRGDPFWSCRLRRLYHFAQNCFFVACLCFPSWVFGRSISL